MSTNGNSLFNYFAYGLNISSAIKIPDLFEGRAAPDVQIRRGVLTDAYLDSLIRTPVLETPGCRVRVSERAISFDWPKFGKFLINKGCEIIVDLPDDAEEIDAMPFLTGPSMIALLHQRGFLVLHGSSVLLNGNAVAFLGASGFGKSTLAASMHVRQHPLISDDVVPVYSKGGASYTTYGYPRIKLYPDSVRSVGTDPTELPFIHRFIEKHSFTCAESGAVNEPLALKALYLLAEGDEIDIVPLSKTLGFVNLVQYTHVNSHLRGLNSQESHFGQCQDLVSQVPIFILKRPRRFDHMDDLCKAVEQHASDLQ